MPLYLDNAATTFPKPESVYQAVDTTMRFLGASAGRGGYRLSLDASRLLFSARKSVADFFSIRDESRVIFTHNATESLNVALRGVLHPGDHVVTSSLEHNSLIRPLHALQQMGVEYTVVPASQDGYINPEDVRRSVTPRTKMVAVTHVSNVYGTVQPIDELAKIAADAGAYFLLDAAQSAGSVCIDVHKTGIDLLAVPGHKGLYGPQGTGVLYVAPHVPIRPVMAGGTGTGSSLIDQPSDLPDGFEAGTRNLPGIAGLKAGIEFVQSVGIETIREHEVNLVAFLAENLMKHDAVILHGFAGNTAHAGVLSFTVRGKDSSAVAFELDQRFGIAVRAGLHCAPGAHKTLGTFPSGTIRVSPGWFTTDEDIAFVSNAIVQCIQ